MGYEEARYRDMAPAEMAGTDAEIVLLAIALREQVLAQQPDVSETVAPDIHAEPVRGRHIHHEAGIRPAHEPVQADGRSFIRDGIDQGTILARIREYRRIVGKRRRCADVGC